MTDQEREEMSAAIEDWKRSAYSEGTPEFRQMCLNAARELEIERDTGKVVHINVRIR